MAAEESALGEGAAAGANHGGGCCCCVHVPLTARAAEADEGVARRWRHYWAVSSPTTAARQQLQSRRLPNRVRWEPGPSGLPAVGCLSPEHLELVVTVSTTSE